MKVSGQLHALDTLLLRITGGPQNRSVHGGKEKLITAPTRNLIPIVQPVA